MGKIKEKSFSTIVFVKQYDPPAMRSCCEIGNKLSFKFKDRNTQASCEYI